MFKLPIYILGFRNSVVINIMEVTCTIEQPKRSLNFYFSEHCLCFPFFYDIISHFFKKLCPATTETNCLLF